MNTNLEIEYKTIVKKDEFDKLISFFDGFEYIEQKNHYFDDDNNTLKKNKMSLRIREFIHKDENNNIFECTIKVSKDKNTKQEINFECYSLNLEEISELKEFLVNIDISSLKEKGSLLTKRSVYKDEYGELCFDINEYNNLTDYEIEYEQTNICDNFFDRFLSILKKADIEYQPSKPKMQRCLESVI